MGFLKRTPVQKTPFPEPEFQQFYTRFRQKCSVWYSPALTLMPSEETWKPVVNGILGASNWQVLLAT